MINLLIDDENKMIDGAHRLLHKKWKAKDKEPECFHESDGMIYDTTDKFQTLRCRLCGVFYDKQIQ
jgi:hypothetical protein